MCDCDHEMLLKPPYCVSQINFGSTSRFWITFIYYFYYPFRQKELKESRVDPSFEMDKFRFDVQGGRRELSLDKGTVS